MDRDAILDALDRLIGAAAPVDTDLPTALAPESVWRPTEEGQPGRGSYSRPQGRYRTTAQRMAGE